jgi:hypothetical protein
MEGMMSQGQLTFMAQRLNRLERSHRRWKLLASGLLGILVLLSLMGATIQKGGNVAEVIRAQRFLLVDEDGKTRAELAVEKGWSGLRLKDANGRVRALLVVEAEGPILELRDKKGRARTTLSVGQRGQSIIQQNIIRTIPRSRLQ